MTLKQLYLKPNPSQSLPGNWRAWGYLISPATASMNITDRHYVPDAYSPTPSINGKAVLNVKMPGELFMGFNSVRIDVQTQSKRSLGRCPEPLYKFISGIKYRAKPNASVNSNKFVNKRGERGIIT